MSATKTSNFTRFVQTGRVVLYTAGPNKGKIGVISEIVDHKRAITLNPTSTPPIFPQSTPLNTITLTPLLLTALPRGAGFAAVKSLMEKEDTVKTWENSSWAKKLAIKEKRKKLTDFDRFSLLIERKRRRDTVRKQLAKKK